MRGKELEKYLQVHYPVDAVPYKKFADLIGKSEAAVKNMVDRNKLPLIVWQNPDSEGDVKTRGENWVYIPEFNRAMRDAFLNRPKEQRDAWLLWVGL
ncbi:Cox family DNA-binding protein [Providencia hangzhouensis]|uniref:Cox family DNA-binding protein n=1 Tax=Providencia hangzhouensis TaxID=3031799 RepID=UPI003F65ED54